MTGKSPIISSMGKFSKFKIVTFLVMVFAAGHFFLGATEGTVPPKGNFRAGSLSFKTAEIDQLQNPELSEERPDLPLIPGQRSLPQSLSEEETRSVVLLRAGNFESFVLRCFEGEPCEMGEDPMRLYEDFKAARKIHAIDHLISFLRKQLQDPRFKDKYKDSLLQMIEDFYVPEEQQFQKAAYYSYVGDPQKSLDLYLDLEKKSKSDPSLRPAPKLNIANAFYEMGKLREALPYYQAALDEYISGDHGALLPSTNDMIRFIEGRIVEIRSKISL